MLRSDGHFDSLDLDRLPSTFTSSLDPHVILTDLVSRTCQILDTARCSVVQLDPEHHPDRAFVFTAAEDPSIAGYSLALSDYPEIGAAIAENRPVLVRDDPADPVAAKIRAVHRELPFPLSVLFPLSYRGENFGVLFLRFADRDHPLGEKELELCQLVAFGSAVALHNAREYQHLLAEVRSREHQAEQVQEAHRLRMEMLAAAAHDLRTPLHSILGYLDLLNEDVYGKLLDAQRETIGHVSDNAQNLLQIVNALVEHARLEDGTMPLEISTGEVARLFEELRATLEPLARLRNVHLVFQTAGPVPLLETDWLKLKRLLLNLLHNALRHGQGAEVTLTAGAGDGRVWFEVKDAGPGISAEHLPHIFDRFYRVNPKRDEGPGGLGLSIVKRYVEMLEAEITVRSEPGEGSHFTVSLRERWNKQP